MERPRQKEHGDYATNVALQLAKKAGTEPARARRAARRPAAEQPTASPRSRSPDPASSTSRSRQGAQGQLAADIVRPGRRTATRDAGRPEDQPRVRLRQPDRPAPPRPHPLGGASATRSAGSSSAAGADVTREFYINDRGAQMDQFGALARWPRAGRAIPEDGYQGDYVDELAVAVVAEQPRSSTCRPTSGERRSARRATSCSSRSSRTQLDDFDTHFDVWFSEQSLHESRRRRARTLERLEDWATCYEDGRRALDADHRLRRRQGPGADPLQRRADLLRVRHRLLRQQARARLRPLHLPARRRPPRLRRAAAAMAACVGDDPDADTSRC